MKNRKKYDLVLFAILAVLAFLPMLQGWFHWFSTKPLNGVTETVEKPAFQAPVAEAKPEPLAEPAAKAPAAQADILLFKTPTCPNCKLAMVLLDKAGVAYTALNANENKELVNEYGVKQAPTMVLLGSDGFQSFRGVSDIKGWLMGKK